MRGGRPHILLPVLCCLFAACAAIAPAFISRAADKPPAFPSRAEEERFLDLARELRCLVCQNQSLADSSAPLAQDLRDQVIERMKRGDSNEQIIEFLVGRYGDFVLYRPPFRPGTWTLWIGPFLLLGLAAFIVIRMSAARHGGGPAPLTQEEARRLREIDGCAQEDPRP